MQAGSDLLGGFAFGQKLQNFWDKYVTQKITSNSENQVIRGLVNLLRNAQMDLFTAVITGLITH